MTCQADYGVTMAAICTSLMKDVPVPAGWLIAFVPWRYSDAEAKETAKHFNAAIWFQLRGVNEPYVMTAQDAVAAGVLPGWPTYTLDVT